MPRCTAPPSVLSNLDPQRFPSSPAPPPLTPTPLRMTAALFPPKLPAPVMAPPTPRTPWISSSQTPPAALTKPWGVGLLFSLPFPLPLVLLPPFLTLALLLPLPRRSSTPWTSPRVSSILPWGPTTLPPSPPIAPLRRLLTCLPLVPAPAGKMLTSLDLSQHPRLPLLPGAPSTTPSPPPPILEALAPPNALLGMPPPTRMTT